MANETHVVHDSRFPPALPSHLIPILGHASTERAGGGGEEGTEGTPRVIKFNSWPQIGGVSRSSRLSP